MPYRDPEKRKAFYKKWNLKNREKLLARKREYCEANRDALSLKRREYYIKNKEIILSRQRKFKHENPEYFKKYDEKRDRTQRGRLRIMFCGISKRIKHKKSYKNRKLHFTFLEFVDRFIDDEQFKTVYAQWIVNNCEYRFCPSLDRIDNNGDYTLDNVQILSLSENSSKRRAG